jgi:hypothetical protein
MRVVLLGGLTRTLGSCNGLVKNDPVTVRTCNNITLTSCNQR